MPTALVPIIAGIGAAVGGAAGAVLIMYAAQIAIAAVIVGTLALSSYQKRKAARAARAAFDSAQVDRLVNIEASVASHELVLGRVRKGGNIFFRTTVGAYKEMYVACIALAAHEIDGIERIYFNEQPIDIDGNGTVLTAPYARWVTRSISGQISGSVTTLEQTPISGSLSVVAVSNSGPSESNESGDIQVGYSLVGMILPPYFRTRAIRNVAPARSEQDAVGQRDAA